MKMNRNLYLFATALMAGTMGMTSCSNEEITPNNPTFDGESVKTQFAINIPAAGKTRMSAENTQNANNFLGIYDIKLVSMTGDPAADSNPTTDFTSIIKLSEITTGEIVDGTNNSKIYENVNVPVGTTNFLFYGAGGTSAPQSDDDRFAKGVIIPSMETSNVEDINFTLNGAKIEVENDEAAAITEVLNNVEKVSGWANETKGSTLGDLYAAFTSMTAGSAKSVCKALENLYYSVDPLENDIADAIKAAIVDGNTFSMTDGSLTTTLSYPRNINMPDGAAILKFDPNAEDGKKFSYATDDDDPKIGTDLGVKMNDICFPASIYYFVNTDLKSNNTVPTNWPTTLEGWQNGFTTWGSSVTNATRAIALTKAIQYGVAGLKLTVKSKSSYLEDSKENDIAIPKNGFKVTGVLIGGQPDKAGWNFNPAAGAAFGKVVYDKDVNIAAKDNAYDGVNYTLVLDNKQYDNNGGVDAKPVNIAIEFENDAVDFYGVDGVVPTGTKFYLIAQLNPDNVIDKELSDYVFMQDHMTVANLTISSLKNAYNTIPDLRATEMQLGLAVDLTWEEGLLFDVEIQ